MSSSLQQELVVRWLNFAYRHVSRPEVFPHLELFDEEQFTMTTSGEYTFTNAVLAVRSVRNISATSPYKLNLVSQEWMDDRTQTAGQPRYFHSTGRAPATLGDYKNTPATRYIQIYPTPSSEFVGKTLEARTILEPVLLADASSVTDLHEIWDEPIIAGAIWRGWLNIGNIPRADIAKEAYVQLVNEVMDQLSLEHTFDPENNWQVDTARHYAPYRS
jgi:hypothetical protein